VDTLIGFRAERHFREVAALRPEEKAEHHPHGYMFKDIPPELSPEDDADAAIGETLELMDKFGIEYGVISITDERSADAVRNHPDRFVGALPVDGNKGMDEIRRIVRLHDELDLRGVTLFPSGVSPQIPLNDKLWYPIYAKCVELDIPVFTTVGVPGPRVKMMAQYVGHLDEVCYDFPELKIVMRHGAEPWEDLAVKLMLKWPNLYYSTSAFAPRYYPKAIIDFANTRGSDKIIYAGYFPFGLTLERVFGEFEDLPLKDEVWPKFLSDNARRVLKLPPAQR
jgi:predicted TIM-barrel fold metal-dependent hydrolase